jgi:hypothetical protein
VRRLDQRTRSTVDALGEDDPICGTELWDHVVEKDLVRKVVVRRHYSPRSRTENSFICQLLPGRGCHILAHPGNLVQWDALRDLALLMARTFVVVASQLPSLLLEVPQGGFIPLKLLGNLVSVASTLAREATKFRRLLSLLLLLLLLLRTL